MLEVKMRTVKKTLLYRLAAQAEEAELRGLTKVAEALTAQITKNSDNVRQNDSFYAYASEEYQKDVEERIWDAIIRSADFYDAGLDALEMQELVQKYAEDLINEVRAKLGNRHGVGAYEPNVPGEIVERIVIELEKE